MSDRETTAASEGRIAARWRALDRGWQALLLGLAIVGAHLAVQPF